LQADAGQNALQPQLAPWASLVATMVVMSPAAEALQQEALQRDAGPAKWDQNPRKIGIGMQYKRDLILNDIYIII
jgi:hypothetical protein